jgi:hypothetical protein
MKKLIYLSLTFFGLSSLVYAQKISETGFEAGISLTHISNFEMEWNNNSSKPVFLSLGVQQSWYNNDSKISIRKELGISLRYENIDLSRGGLGAGSSYSGSVTGLYLSPSVLAHFKVFPKLAADLGPSMDYLVVGLNHLTQSSYSVLPGYGENGETQIKGLNRDYFSKPSYGIKARLTGISVEEKFTVGMSFSYLWTKAVPSDFYVKNYFRIGFTIGFKKGKAPTNIQDKQTDDTEKQ